MLKIKKYYEFTKGILERFGPHDNINNVFRKHKIIDLNKYGKYLTVNNMSRPYMLFCETTNTCTNNCIICAYSKMTRDKVVMPLELFEKVLKDYSEMGGGRLSLTPLVGEVFLDPHLLDRLMLINKHEKITAVSITTNVVPVDRFDDEELKFILKNLTKIFVSIYGIDEDEYLIMAKRNYYDRVVKNIKRILRLCDDHSKIGFGFRLLKDRTEDEIQRWIMENFGAEVKYLNCRRYANWGGILDTSKPLPFDAKWIEARENKTQCFIPLMAVEVFSNGEVTFCPCDDFNADEELRLGNVKEESLLNMYNSEKTRKLWDFKGGNMPSFCRRCSFHRPLPTLPEQEEFFENPYDYLA